MQKATISNDWKTTLGCFVTVACGACGVGPTLLSAAGVVALW